MAKTLRTVALVVGAVALVATGVGIAMGGLAAGAATAAAGSAMAIGSTLVTVGTIASVAAGVLSLGATLMTPKPSFSGNGNPQQFQTNPQSGLPYNLGRGAFAGLKIRGATASWRGAWKQDLLCFGIMLSVAGPIQAMEKFTADNVEVLFPGDGAIGTYNDWMWQRWSLGAQSGPANGLIGRYGVPFPDWTSEHKLTGIAHSLMMLRYDFDGEKFSSGVPQPRWVAKWVKVYDPRLDSTYPGGSGSCRALDETTYVWSRNPGLHALTWCLGRWSNGKLTVGIGAPVKMIRVADFVQAANVADANGWGCGGTVYSLDAKWGVLKSMLQACGAEPTKTAAMMGCRVNMPRVSIATITTADVLDSLSTAVTKPRRERINTVRPRFRSEDHDWEVITGSTLQVADYVTADKGELAKELDLPLVQAEIGQEGFDGAKQAGQLAAYYMVNSREAGPISFATGPKFVGLRNGDCVTLNVPEKGHDNTKVLLTSDPVFDPASGKFRFTCETETDAKHAFALGQTTTPPPAFHPTVPDLVPEVPDAADWTLSASSGADGLPLLLLQGLDDDPYWDSVLVSYRKVGATSWTFWGSIVDRAVQRAEITGIDGAVSYEVQIAYGSTLAHGEWLDLGTVTTAANGLQLLAQDAKDTADSKRRIFIQSTAPSHLDSEESDLWINEADGNRLYKRVAGSGLLSIGGNRITIGGDGIILCWTVADDQRIAQSILDAAGALAVADKKVESFTMLSASEAEPVGVGIGDLLFRAYLDPVEVDHWSGSAWQPAATYGATVAQIEATEAAQAAADTALADLSAIASDNLLTPDEKPRVIQDRDVLLAEQAGIDAQATSFGVTTEKAAYDSAITALTSYLATLTSPVLWSNLTGNTTIVGATFRTKFADVYGARQALLNEMTEIAKARGDAANLAASAAQATASGAATDATSALNQLGVIASDNWLSRGEKPQIIARWQTISDEQAGIDAQATSFGITTEKTTYDNAVTALLTYLGGLSPSWNNVAFDTAITPATFNGKFSDVYYARQALLNQIAAVAALRASWSGVTGSGKPADNATVGAPTGTPVGSIDAGDVSGTIRPGGTVEDDQVDSDALQPSAAVSRSLFSTVAYVPAQTNAYAPIYMALNTDYIVVSGSFAKERDDSALSITASCTTVSDNDVYMQWFVRIKPSAGSTWTDLVPNSALPSYLDEYDIPVQFGWPFTELGTKLSDWATVVISDTFRDSIVDSQRTIFSDANALSAGTYDIRFVGRPTNGSEAPSGGQLILPGATITIEELKKQA